MRRFFTITFIALFIIFGMALNVQAADVATWADLTDELANGTDSEVTLTTALSVTDTQTLNLNGKKLTLKDSLVVDGGKLTITGNGIITTEEAYPLIQVKTGSTLVLENGTYSSTENGGAVVRITGSTSTDGTPATVVTIGENAKLSANYGVVIAQNSGAAYGVEVNVYGTIEGITGNNGYKDGSIAITTNGNIKAPTTEGADVAEINIYDTAKITAVEGTTGNMNSDDGPAIYAAGYAVWNIYGGYIKGSEALSIKGGKFYVKGGELIGTGKFNPEPDAYNDGSEATGSAISITENQKYAGNIVIEVSNATVTSEKGYAVFETVTDKALQPAINDMKIVSGDYSGAQGDVKAETQTNFIQGGTFTDELDEEYLDTTVESEKTEDGTVLVGTKNTITVNTTTNGKVTSSLAEAIEGQTIKLTVTPEEGYQLKSLKVNGAKITETTFTMPNEDVEVTAEFEKIPVKAEENKEENKEEKDETPKMGAMNISYVWMTLIAISLVGIVTTKKVSKHSK